MAIAVGGLAKKKAMFANKEYINHILECFQNKMEENIPRVKFI